MNFASDNAYGAWPEMLAALSHANDGAVQSYGDDEITSRMREKFSRVFGRDVIVHPVMTGTAANALALATLVPPHGAILCHKESHIARDECGAVEFYTHGAKLVEIEGEGAKLTPDAIESALNHFQKGFVHHSQPKAISITQASELGTVYTCEEIAAIAGLAHAHDMKLHMDGARFANALVHLGCTPAEATWAAGVDALSFGATKNGALAAEAVIFFNADDAADFEYRRKKAGHLLSKMRFVSAQLEAALDNNLWLKRAAHANTLARRMGDALAQVPGAELAHPVQSNAIFVRLPDATVARLRETGARFYDWEPPQGGRTLVRLVLSFATPEQDVVRFLSIARK
ncbi:MAG TPA: low specificity L-threonine aldolase [Rhizomicrobium sp.]|nr:low specificity L-threonine aldolase [Rhizomicrobium sp.]